MEIKKPRGDLTWKGKRVDDMDRDQLLALIYRMGEMMEQDRERHQREFQLMSDLRAARQRTWQ